MLKSCLAVNTYLIVYYGDTTTRSLLSIFIECRNISILNLKHVIGEQEAMASQVLFQASSDKQTIPNILASLLQHSIEAESIKILNVNECTLSETSSKYNRQDVSQIAWRQQFWLEDDTLNW